jgi:hypothetical protein
MKQYLLHKNEIIDASLHFVTFCHCYTIPHTEIMAPTSRNFLESCHCSEIIHISQVYSTSVYVIDDHIKKKHYNNV